MAVLLTRERKVISATYGTFLATERQGYCPQHRDLPPARSRQLSRIVPAGANHAYDVLVRVGIGRFLRCRQGKEIRMELSYRYGIEVCPSTISYLARKFVAYFQVVHQQSVPLLRADMRLRGGYILHVDGSCEEGSHVLLVCVDSLSGQVLDSRKTSSENKKEITAVLKGVRRDWGIPLAVVHDLRRALITAVGEVFKGVPQFVCHYHLAADVGKDILAPDVDRLRSLFRHCKARPKLRALVRSIKEFAIPEGGSEHTAALIMEARSKKKLQEYSTPEAVKGAVHALASWILAFGQDGQGYGFPFDMPYMSLYERIVNVHKALRGKGRAWPRGNRGPFGALNRLTTILDTVVTDEYAGEFKEIVTQTKRDMRIFERFRSALRICPKGRKAGTRDGGAAKPLSPKRHKAVLRDLRASLKKKAGRKGPAAGACRIVVQHLDKYWPFLFGHVRRAGSRKIVVPRTNNFQEALFGIVKRQCRRLHGRGHLLRDIETMSPATPLLLNLNNPDYCTTVYGGQEADRIAERFSAVDPNVPAQLLRRWQQERVSTTMPRKLAALEDLPKQVVRFLSEAVREL